MLRLFWLLNGNINVARGWQISGLLGTLETCFNQFTYGLRCSHGAIQVSTEERRHGILAPAEITTSDCRKRGIVSSGEPAITTEDPKEVAPGYPTANSLDELDVSNWEPAAVFTPAESAIHVPAEQTDE